MGPEQRYRGESTEADVAVAMSFAGHMNIELIQPKDNKPSVLSGRSGVCASSLAPAGWT
jgi:hypothetical protein